MFILGSNSETRAKILQENEVFDFAQKGCSFDEEKIDAKSPLSFVYQATKGKLEACLNEFGNELPILCADTVIESNGEILRKAKNREDAERILKIQSGNKINIITCIFYSKKELFFSDISVTTYQFKEFEKEDLEKYLLSNKWQGKAGACMVEGFCKKYIESVTGYESCARGLTIEKLKNFL